MRYRGYKYVNKSSRDLENKVKVTKSEILITFKLVPMKYPGKYGGIPSTGSRDIVGTRIFHANADTDAGTNGIRTETKMSPSPWAGGHKYLEVFILQSGHDYVVEMASFNVQRAITPKTCNPVTVPAFSTTAHGA